MGSFTGTCEIFEAREENNPVKYSSRSHALNSGLRDNEKKPPLPKVYKHSIKDGINHLFEGVNVKNASKSLDLSQVGPSPLRKNVLKKPITKSGYHSPGIGISEPVSLKQALRDLSVSKASGMATTKWLSESADFSENSKARQIKTLYNSVVVDNGKGSMVEISLVPKESKQSSSRKTPEHVLVPKVKSLSKSANSSPRLDAVTTQNCSKPLPVKNRSSSASRKAGLQTLKEEITRKDRNASAPSASNIVGNDRDGNYSASTKATNKVFPSNPGEKGRLQIVPPSNCIDGNKASNLTRNTGESVKPVIRNKNSVKKKVKQDSSFANSGSSVQNTVDIANDVSRSQLLCERCHCTLKNANKDSEKDSLAASCSSSLGNEGNLSNEIYGASKLGTRAPDVKVKRNTIVQDKGEISQNSNSSHGVYSTSTMSISDESYVSRSSCSTRPHMSKVFKWEVIRQFRSQHGALSLKHFKFLKKLGCGDIGAVYLAELVGKNCLFAIKVMDNEFLEKRNKMPRTETESEILKILDHPFLATLYAQFTSDNLSCLVMDYCPGGDLHVLRQKQPGRVFPEPAARFYVAEVLLALEYLHMLGIVYRDLKPENVLVREDGHIMLTDFDLSLRCSVNPILLKSSSIVPNPGKMPRPSTESSCIEPFCIEPSCQVSCFSPRFLPSAAKTRKYKTAHSNQTQSLPQLVAEPTDARSNSFVGTHEYLAPEIIKGDGHGAAVDWWTFGIFLYELVCGKTPFKGSNNEETLANVVLQSLKFPDSPLVSFKARDLIRKLLVKESENRFGSEKGATEIKQHPFFEGINWALIRCAIPPEFSELCGFDVPNVSVQGKEEYLECKATGEHLDFDLF